MKMWIIISSLAVIQITILGIGINFKINVGEVQQTENSLNYLTNSRTIASFILASNESQVISPESIGPFMPIQLETCKKQDLTLVSTCNKPQLQLKMDTSKWVQTSLGRKL
jgi:hypothetical protein